MTDSLKNFRFKNLTIWQNCIFIAEKMFDIVEKLANKRPYMFIEQLCEAALSISNNIAEGNGSFCDKDFANCLVIARKSTCECANMLIIFERRNFIDHKTRNELF